MKEFKKIAIANRGEVAVRIIHACKELGIKSVLLHSEADIKSRAYRMADESICIGPADVSASYLSIEANIQGALASGADAVHPGFGFLSENDKFAQACLDNKITFIGPWPETIANLGDKITAKRIVEEQGIPSIPGYRGENQETQHLVEQSKLIGFPVIVKAAAGGGGRGMKVIHAEEQAYDLIESAKREGLSAFGSDAVFLEKYLDRAKHIEVQIFGDLRGQAIHLFERECSLQRRHQKVIEEARSATLSDVLREAVTSSAVKLAKAVQYVGAGTVEFLVQDGQYYFLEMNTRLQVEHPVTELILGIDLVKSQILVQMGRMTLWPQESLQPRGHAMECRIYAENPESPGIPSIGEVLYQHFPDAPGRRFDYAFDAGDEVTPYYDSMIAKVIVWDESRNRTILKMIETLQETVIFGVQTNIPFLLELLQQEAFIDGTFTTKYLEENYPEGLPVRSLPEKEESFLEWMTDEAEQGSAYGISQAEGVVPSPWAKAWRNI